MMFSVKDSLIKGAETMTREKSLLVKREDNKYKKKSGDSRKMTRERVRELTI